MIEVIGSREVAAAVLSLRLARRDIRRDITRGVRSEATPLWRSAVNTRARSRRARVVIASNARATVTSKGFKLTAATSGRPLRGGLVPARGYAGDEFGAHTKRITVRQRSRKGRVYTRSFMMNRQFPGRTREGQVAFDAASVVGRKLVALMVVEVVDGFRRVPGVEVVS